jgi:hypothetical protein
MVSLGFVQTCEFRPEQIRTKFLQLAFNLTRMYNIFMKSQVLLILLAVYIPISFTLTLFYLRFRRCSILEMAGWGSLAIAIPVLGPFFVIAARPGPRKRARRNSLIYSARHSKG